MMPRLPGSFRLMTYSNRVQADGAILRVLSGAFAFGHIPESFVRAHAAEKERKKLVSASLGWVKRDCLHEESLVCLDVLEFVQLVLPAAIELQPHLDAAKDHFFASFEINAELNCVAIVDREWFGFLSGRTQSNMVKKGPATTFHIFDVPFAAFVPKLAMAAAHNLGLEAHRRR